MISNLNKIFENDFIRVPRFLVHKFGLNEAVFLSEVYSEYNYWREKRRLQQGGWFFSTIENMRKNTGLTRHQQLTAMKKLRDQGIIQVKYHGMPKKRYFKFNPIVYNQIYEEFQASLNSSDEEFEDDYEYYLEYEECFEDEDNYEYDYEDDCKAGLEFENCFTGEKIRSEKLETEFKFSF